MSLADGQGAGSVLKSYVLSLDLPGTCQSGTLNALEIVDSSATSVNALDPALNLIGVSVEYYQ
jgi:hypothetical protein